MRGFGKAGSFLPAAEVLHKHQTISEQIAIHEATTLG